MTIFIGQLQGASGACASKLSSIALHTAAGAGHFINEPEATLLLFLSLTGDYSDFSSECHMQPFFSVLTSLAAWTLHFTSRCKPRLGHHTSQRFRIIIIIKIIVVRIKILIIIVIIIMVIIIIIVIVIVLIIAHSHLSLPAPCRSVAVSGRLEFSLLCRDPLPLRRSGVVCISCFNLPPLRLDAQGRRGL